MSPRFLQIEKCNGCPSYRCAGDDETDESMFRVNDDKIISINVGNNPNTAAKFRIASPKAFGNYLMQCLEILSSEHNAASGKVVR